MLNWHRYRHILVVPSSAVSGMPVLPAAESTNANIVPIGLQAIDDDDEQSQDEIQRWSNSSCSTSSRGDGGEEDAAANARQLEQQT